jgi:hypothetical protein
MGVHDKEWYPLSGEYRAVGIFGIIYYSGILAFALYSSYFKCKVIIRKYFYYITVTTLLFEYPRFFSLAIDGSYRCTTCYSMHIIASGLFFGCIAYVAFSFAHILELGPFISMFFSKKGMLN